jgi:homoserine O-acetyltransferase
MEADLTFASAEPFGLERGGKLQPVTLHYAIYGDLDRNRDRVVLVCHALSGSARIADWWAELFNRNSPFDLENYCFIGVNILGSCYGSTGPKSVNPSTGKAYGAGFPIVTVGDIVRSQATLLDHLGVKKLHVVIGASIGGMQALNWALQFPERIERAIVIGTAPLNALGLALNHLQRQSIWNDPAWNNGDYPVQPAKGLGHARATAMLSYKSSQLFDDRYGRRPNRNGEDPFTAAAARFDVGGYLDHQQEKFVKRFDANSYITITKIMDLWDVPAEGSTEYQALAKNRVEIDLVGISSDWLFPPQQVRKLHERLLRSGVASRYLELETNHGHDGFLADADSLFALLRKALEGRAEARTLALAAD